MSTGLAKNAADKLVRVSRAFRRDLLVGLIAVALAGWVTSSLWINPNHRAIGVNSGDQALFEWLLGYGAYAITHGVNPLFTYLMNVPDGVNLAANTSITVYAVAFAPLTLTLGAQTTFLIILTFNLAATAVAWYWLFSRHLHASTIGAAIGGLFCGFAPAMISHANSHLNWTAQWVIPLIIARVLLLFRRDKPVKDGLILGLVIALCFSLAAEALFFTALALGVFSVSWAIMTRTKPTRGFLGGLGIAAIVSGALLAYPLWLHFAGPQTFHGTGFDPKVHNEDLAAYASWPDRSLAGAAGLNTHLAPNPTEENSFFGIPLLILTIVGFGLLWRHAWAKALAITAFVFAVLSLGPRLRILGRLTEFPLPEAWLSGLPIFNAALPSRLALIVAPIIGIVLAKLITARPGKLVAAGVAVALIPLIPIPLLGRDREPVPRFFTSGIWRSYVADQEVIVPIPLPDDLTPDGQRWQTEALIDAARDRDNGVFRIPAGFFLGPGGPNGTGRIGPVPRHTAELLADVAKTGQVPILTDADKQAARDDLKFWDAKIVVMADTVHGAHWEPHYQEVFKVISALLGPPQRVDDVWLWQVP